jgi:hypothetical protein
MAFDFSTRGNDRVTFNRAIPDLSGRHARIYKAQATHQDWRYAMAKFLVLQPLESFAFDPPSLSFTYMFRHLFERKTSCRWARI